MELISSTTEQKALSHSQILAKDAVYILMGSLFLALCSQVSFVLPATMIPFSMQVFGILVIGMVLGPRRGTMAVLTYLLEGAMGLPVFAVGGIGLASLLGPTGGFFLGFIPAAWVIGTMTQGNGSLWQRIVALMLGDAIILLGGALWMSVWIGPSAAIALGVIPFLGVDALKIVMALAAFPAIRKLRSWI